MTNAELNEATFVLAGYAIFTWVYYKFIMKRMKKEKDKYLKILKAYVYTMFTMPICFFVLAVLSCLYSALFGGAR